MGEVYRARDPRLDREVAIKVLAPALADDPAALARFEREAMSVARLSHANILAIHEFGRDGATAFVVTELVDGETLRARLVGGALPPRRATAYALQIAKGMAAAHARGVVHRDLKPENVMITRDDQVKILDFGLAKPLEATGSDMTRTAGAATTPGTVLGTFGYMAPEQVRGVAVDHRADMFSFGAVLYEMLTGLRAFKGDTPADTMTAILTKDPPDLDSARLAIAPGLERIVRRCLEKTPELRFQSANDLAFALDTLASVSTSSAALDTAAAPRRPHGKWGPWIVAASAAVVAAWSWFRPAASIAPEPRWSAFTRITESSAQETSPTLSPDGNTVAYAATNRGGWDIFLQRVGGRNATAIINDPQRNERGPVFSPDGSLIAFHDSSGGGGIFVAGATGESVRRVTDFGFDPAWSPDGKQIAFATDEVDDPAARYGDSTLYVVDAAGGAPRQIIQTDGMQPSWSPSGDRLVYWSNIRGQRDINTVAASGGQPVPVTNDAAIDWCPVWSPDGRFIYFASDRGTAMNLWRIPIEQESGRPIGAAEPVTAGVHASTTLPRFSRDGNRLTLRTRLRSINLVAIPFDPVAMRAGTPSLLETGDHIRIPSDTSPDGKLIALQSTGEHQEDIFLRTAEGAIRRVTDDPARDREPGFTSDGRSLVFYSNRGGKWEPWLIGIDGGGLRKLTNAPTGAVSIQISPKGDAAVLVGDASRRLYLAPVGPSDSIARELRGGLDGGSFNPTGWSADGTRLGGFVVSNSGRPAGVGVYDLSAQRATVVSPDHTYAVKWLADSRRIMYFTDGGWTLIVLNTVARKRTVVPVQLPGPSVNDMFAISRDNRTIYYGAETGDSDIWIVDRK